MTESTRTRRELILASVSDAVADLMYYDRKEDEHLPRYAIEAAIAAGEVGVEEMVDLFRGEILRRVE